MASHQRSLPFLIAFGYLFISTASAQQPPSLRLPETATPLNYRVELTLDPQKDVFSGHVVVSLGVKKSSDVLWLNASHLEISKAVMQSGGQSLTAKVVPGGEDFAGFQFAQPLATGPAQLDVTYTGHIQKQGSSGIFSMEDSGNPYLFTQFEQIDARAAFPCFDEPGYKTPWQLTLMVPAKYDTVSNTPEANTVNRGGSKTVSFARTKPLPSYLIAFAVGQFDFVPAGFAGKNRAPVRIVTPKGHANEAKYAAEVTATILSRLEDYFGIPFPYEKSDQVAIPLTFGFGAMENAGMVTYAQNILLASPDSDSLRRQRGYASVAAHELAHQWFGDLVTTAWWNDIWLNEAFATWMEQHLLAEWKPEWQTTVEDVGSKLYAQREDTLLSARKIRQEIESKDDISNAFDGITYQKGAAVIGMFENYVGAANFQKGVQAYLKKYAFGAATAPQFLQTVSSTIGKDISGPFNSFLNQAGVPLLSIALDCSGSKPTLHLQQQRSLPIGVTESRKQTWQIPVCVRFGGDGSPSTACTLMSDPRTNWALESADCPAWVEANKEAKGYYRVDYQGTLLPALVKGTVQSRLSAAERADLLGNEQALARSGQASMDAVLGLIPAFSNDASRFVTERAIALAEMPSGHLLSENLVPNYQRFLEKSFAARAHELGWTPKPNEDDDAKMLRPQLLNFLATDGGDKALGKEALALTDKWLRDHNALDGNLARLVLQSAAYWGDKTLFDRFMEALKQTRDQQQRQRIIAALASFRDPSSIKAGMNAVLSGDISFLEGGSLLFSGQNWPETRRLAFDFVKAHFEEIKSRRATGGGSDSGAQLPRVGVEFCDAQSRDELKAFFEPKVSQFVGAPRVLAQTLETIDSCIAFKKLQEPSTAQFLKNY